MKKILALDPVEREQECLHEHGHWNGTIPCTGKYICNMCGLEIDPTTHLLTLSAELFARIKTDYPIRGGKVNMAKIATIPLNARELALLDECLEYCQEKIEYIEDTCDEYIADELKELRIKLSSAQPMQEADTREWYFTLTSTEYGTDELGGYGTKGEAEAAIARVTANAAELNDGVIRIYSEPYQKEVK